MKAEATIADTPASLQPRLNGRRERHMKEYLNRLVVAARELMADQGLDNATVQDVTEAADVGKGTFFSYFRSKAHIIPVLLQRADESLEEALEQAKQGTSVLQLLEDVLVACPFDGLATSERGAGTYFRSCLFAMMSNEEVRELSGERLESQRRRVEALLRIGQERGEIRSDCSASDLSQLVQAVRFGARMNAWLMGPRPSAFQSSAAAVALLRSITQSKTGRPAPRRRSQPSQL